MSDEATNFLIEQIRKGDQSAWEDLIQRYEGRLTAFVRSRLREPNTVDDVVQETFLGLLRSLPHYDPKRDLESYLFTIAAHKVRDELRRQGRHPLAYFEDLTSSTNSSATPIEPIGYARGASSIMASAERVERESATLGRMLGQMIEQWQSEGDFRRVKCVELLFVLGWGNKEVAQFLDLTEQQVANYKFQVVERLNRLITKQA